MYFRWSIASTNEADTDTSDRDGGKMEHLWYLTYGHDCISPASKGRTKRHRNLQMTSQHVPCSVLYSLKRSRSYMSKLTFHPLTKSILA